MIRTPLVLAALFSLCALSTLPAAAQDGPARHGGAAGGDRLVVTVERAGGLADGRFELRCHPEGGSHRQAREACARLDEVTTWGKDPFGPVAKDAMCTMQYGGPQTARVEGTWAGRPVRAVFSRGNGCEIARWNNLVPLLPSLTGHPGAQ